MMNLKTHNGVVTVTTSKVNSILFKMGTFSLFTYYVHREKW